MLFITKWVNQNNKKIRFYVCLKYNKFGPLSFHIKTKHPSECPCLLNRKSSKYVYMVTQFIETLKEENRFKRKYPFALKKNKIK